MDIKELVTKKEGPLPIWGWFLVGAGGWWLLSRYLKSKGTNSTASTAQTSPAIYSSGGGNPGGGGPGGSGGGVTCPSGFNADPTGTFCIPANPISCLAPSTLINGVCTSPVDQPFPQQNNCLVHFNGQCFNSFTDASSYAASIGQQSQFYQQVVVPNSPGIVQSVPVGTSPPPGGGSGGYFQPSPQPPGAQYGGSGNGGFGLCPGAPAGGPGPGIVFVPGCGFRYVAG